MLDRTISKTFKLNKIKKISEMKRMKKKPRSKEALVVSKVTKAFHDKSKIMPSWLSKETAKTKFYAVNNVSLDVKEGEIFGILGPNGCGKSTLIRIVSTLLMPDTGDVRVFGFDVIKEPDHIKEFINRVSVEASFFKRLSANENLMYASRLYGLNPKKAKQKFTYILEELGFPMDKLNQPMENFSRGLQQKVSIARGFLTDPILILLDEPTTGLDPKSKLDVQRFIKKIRAEKKITIILTSHDMEEVDRLCKRIAIMDKGKIIALGTSKELKKLVSKDDLFSLQTSNNKQAIKILEQVDGINNLKLEDGSISFNTKDLDAVLNEITRKLKKNNLKIKTFHKTTPTLEDVFLKLTGKTLEEEDKERGK